MEAYQALGLRHSDFARAADVSLSTLHRVEQAKGGAPSAITLQRIERALGWPSGTATAVADGAEAPAPQAGGLVRIKRPAAFSDPSVLDQLPTQIREELQRSGELLGVDVVDLGPSEAGARMIVVVARDSSGADPDPDALRATLDEWQRKRKELWRHDSSPPA
ncbi:helix-turn-helix domain-containing protein [Kitasatospora indigofera]|uniref:helix-turn-helix domain-containing protein n=1 Tax=Kitasatospora indigofera TaxID=67307 RepID=UPI0036C5DB3F